MFNSIIGKKAYVLTAKDMLTLRPYYSEEEFRRMTNDDITNRLITLLKKQKDKVGVDVNSLNDEMQELKRELEKRANKKSKSDEKLDVQEAEMNTYESLTTEELIKQLRIYNQIQIYSVYEKWCVQLFDLSICPNEINVSCIWEDSDKNLKKVLIRAVEHIVEDYNEVIK